MTDDRIEQAKRDLATARAAAIICDVAHPLESPQHYEQATDALEDLITDLVDERDEAMENHRQAMIAVGELTAERDEWEAIARVLADLLSEPAVGCFTFAARERVFTWAREQVSPAVTTEAGHITTEATDEEAKQEAADFRHDLEMER